MAKFTLPSNWRVNLSWINKNVMNLIDKIINKQVTIIAKKISQWLTKVSEQICHTNF